MKNYTFQEWSRDRVVSEGVDSEPQPGDFVITNPKAFMDSVVSKSGKLKNDGIANLRNFSRFKVNNVDGRKVKGSVSHQTYSGGHSKKFNSYDFLDVSPAFDKGENKVWLNNAPGRRATAHYINKMYPIWAGKMGMEGFATPEEQLDAQLASDEREAEAEMMQQAAEQDPQYQDPQYQEPQYKKYQDPYQQQAPEQPQIQYRPIQTQQQPYNQIQNPQGQQDQQSAPWEKPQSQQSQSYTMQNREVVPSSNMGSDPNFGFDDPSGSYENDSIPMSNSEPFDMGDMGATDDMRLAANYDPNAGKTYKYYPE